MTARSAARNGQNRVEKQHTLPRPCRQIAAFGRLHPHIVGKLTENIAQRGRKRRPGRNGKGQPHGLSRLVIGILSQNDGAHTLRRRTGQREEFPPCRRIDLLRSPGGVEPLRQLLKVCRMKLRRKRRRPCAEL